MIITDKRDFHTYRWKILNRFLIYCAFSPVIRAGLPDTFRLGESDGFRV